MSALERMSITILESILYGDDCEDDFSLMKAYHERYQRMSFLARRKIEFQKWKETPKEHVSLCFIGPQWSILTSEPVTFVLSGSFSPLSSTLFYDDRVVSPCFIVLVQRYLMSHGAMQKDFMTWSNWKDEHIQAICLPVHYSVMERAVIFVINNFIHEQRRLDEFMEPLDIN